MNGPADYGAHTAPRPRHEECLEWRRVLTSWSAGAAAGAAEGRLLLTGRGLDVMNPEEANSVVQLPGELHSAADMADGAYPWLVAGSWRWAAARAGVQLDSSESWAAGTQGFGRSGNAR